MPKKRELPKLSEEERHALAGRYGILFCGYAHTCEGDCRGCYTALEVIYGERRLVDLMERERFAAGKGAA